METGPARMPRCGPSWQGACSERPARRSTSPSRPRTTPKGASSHNSKGGMLRPRCPCMNSAVLVSTVHFNSEWKPSSWTCTSCQCSKRRSQLGTSQLHLLACRLLEVHTSSTLVDHSLKLACPHISFAQYNDMSPVLQQCGHSLLRVAASNA